MKLNFGHGILMIILLFMTGISILVYKCSKQRVDLVNVSYYEQELKYNDQMAKEKNSLSLSDDLSIGYDPGNNSIAFNFPPALEIKDLSGNISFYKPDNASLDFSKPVIAGRQHRQVIGTAGMARGYWNVKVNWKNGTTPYYSETRIFIN
jgi:hypothetical protein